MVYSELIKDVNRIRPYIRDFYVFGLYTRNEYAARYGISPRSYDNERRRVESWRQEYLNFYQNSSGKKCSCLLTGVRSFIIRFIGLLRQRVLQRMMYCYISF